MRKHLEASIMTGIVISLFTGLGFLFAYYPMEMTVGFVALVVVFVIYQIYTFFLED